jgi:hypothetical protein
VRLSALIPSELTDGLNERHAIGGYSIFLHFICNSVQMLPMYQHGERVNSRVGSDAKETQKGAVKFGVITYAIFADIILSIN